MSIEEHFATAEDCYREMAVAREACGSLETTEAQWRQVAKTLALMVLYCPESVRHSALAQLEETHKRAFMLGIDL